MVFGWFKASYILNKKKILKYDTVEVSWEQIWLYMIVKNV